MKTVKCSACPKDVFLNEATDVQGYTLCKDCADTVLAMLNDRLFLGAMYRKSAMSSGEVTRMWREKAKEYALSDFTMYAVAGYPTMAALPGVNA